VSVSDLLTLIKLFEEKDAALISLLENFNTTIVTGKLVFNIFSSIADFERNLIIDRTRIGLKSAKARRSHG